MESAPPTIPGPSGTQPTVEFRMSHDLLSSSSCRMCWNNGMFEEWNMKLSEFVQNNLVGLCVLCRWTCHSRNKPRLFTHGPRTPILACGMPRKSWSTALQPAYGSMLGMRTRPRGMIPLSGAATTRTTKTGPSCCQLAGMARSCQTSQPLVLHRKGRSERTGISEVKL
jgi:hypothetical protein